MLNKSTQITKIYLPKELFSIMIFMVMRMDCLFCKIVNNEVESKKIYENDKVIAILDAYPDVDGHTLIIPKKHYTDFKELDEEILNHINKVAKMLSEKLMTTLNSSGLALIANYGDRQVIKHFHLHLLPDYQKKKASKSPQEIFELLK